MAVTLELLASGLEKKELLGPGKPSAYIRVMKSVDGQWVAVYRTEPVPRTASPAWHPFTLPMHVVNGGDQARPVRLEVRPRPRGSLPQLSLLAVLALEPLGLGCSPGCI